MKDLRKNSNWLIFSGTGFPSLGVGSAFDYSAIPDTLAAFGKKPVELSLSFSVRRVSSLIIICSISAVAACAAASNLSRTLMQNITWVWIKNDY